MRPRVALLMMAWPFLACESPPASCPVAPELLPPVGSGPALMSSLVPGATEQSLTMPSARDYVEYRFTRDGISYSARYVLGRTPPAPVLSFVFVRRPAPLRDCGALAGLGPVVDAIELRRNGVVISHGEMAYESRARCPGQGLTDKGPPSLSGSPDGDGAPLSDAEYGWRWSGKVTAQSGDEVIVTVLDTSGEPFDLLAGYQQTQPTVALGALTGSGVVRVP